MTHYIVWTLLFQKLWENRRGHRHNSLNYCVLGQNCTSLLQGQAVISYSSAADCTHCLTVSSASHKPPPTLLFKPKQLLTSKLHWRKGNHRATPSTSFWPHLHGTNNFKWGSEECYFQIYVFIIFKHSVDQTAPPVSLFWLRIQPDNRAVFCSRVPSAEVLNVTISSLC